MNTRAQHLEAFGRLLDIMDDLREKCPWDRKQTFESLRHLTIEETYELADAILDADVEEIKKETGDLLLHMVFYAKLGSELPKEKAGTTSPTPSTAFATSSWSDTPTSTATWRRTTRKR